MRLSVKHPSVLPIRTRNLELSILIRLNQVRVLEHLGEEEGLLEIGEIAAVGSVDVGDGAVAAADAGVLDDVLEAGEGPLRLGLVSTLPLVCERWNDLREVEDVRLDTCDRQWRGKRSRTIPAPRGARCSSRS